MLNLAIQTDGVKFGNSEMGGSWKLELLSSWYRHDWLCFWSTKPKGNMTCRWSLNGVKWLIDVYLLCRILLCIYTVHVLYYINIVVFLSYIVLSCILPCLSALLLVPALHWSCRFPTCFHPVMQAVRARAWLEAGVLESFQHMELLQKWDHTWLVGYSIRNAYPQSETRMMHSMIVLNHDSSQRMVSLFLHIVSWNWVEMLLEPWGAIWSCVRTMFMRKSLWWFPVSGWWWLLLFMDVYDLLYFS